MTYNDNYNEEMSCRPLKSSIINKTNNSKSKRTILECGDGTGSRSFTSSSDENIQLAYVNLDTKVLGKSKVLIKFSNLIRIDAFQSGATVRLRYQLFKACEKEEAKLLGSWIFEEAGSAPVVFEIQEESFSFIFCECISSPKCFQYFVTVTPIEIIDASVIVSNTRIAALSQSLCDYSEDEYKVCFDKENIKVYDKSKDIILACGKGNGSITYRQATILQSPVTIAQTTIDTSCLIKPRVLIEFSSIINTAFRVNDVGLEFELFRVCGEGTPLSLGTWIFERTNNVIPTAIDNSFSFVFCEEVLCTGCCEYFVTVKGRELNVSDPAIYLGVKVDNARLTAVLQSSKESFKYQDCKIHDKRDRPSKYTLKDSRAKSKEILLSCGTGTGEKTFISSNDSAFQLANTTIDTSSLRKPVINIDFSSIVSFQNLVDQGRAELRYELFRACDGREPISLGIWTISRLDFRIIDRSTNSFEFTFCDCEACPGCCDYFVTVTPLEITEGFITVTVRDGQMAALAGEG